jgi:hypothetical protein
VNASRLTARGQPHNAQLRILGTEKVAGSIPALGLGGLQAAIGQDADLEPRPPVALDGAVDELPSVRTAVRVVGFGHRAESVSTRHR